METLGPISIPGYELLNKVGEGGMGTVYRARQLSLQRVVAVKVLRGLANGSPAPQAFQRETQLLASLSHPNVVAIHDCAQSDGRHYLVTEFVPGTSLRSLMKPGEPWAIPKAAALLDKVAAALSYIHQHGILHLDLKPENVLCTPEGEIKIADFGLAQPQAEARASAEVGQGQGTVDYCSLEQRHALPTDERSDLYSLAVLSYELLTGHLPGRVYETASSHNTELPVAAEDVLRRGLSRWPDDRHGSVEDFRRELLAALQPKKRRLRVALLVTAMLSTVVMFCLFWFVFMEPLPTQTVWFIVDDPEGLAAFAGISDGSADPIPDVVVSGRYPEGDGQPPLPLWPKPCPVMFMKSAEASGFFHPLFAGDAGKEVLATWPALAKWPAIRPEDNFLLVGDFAGKRIWYKDDGPWSQPPEHNWTIGDGIRVACPPDQPENSALLMDKSGTTEPSELLCYQWLPRIPEHPGTVMVLRYRARAEQGTGRLSVRPTMPLHIPINDNSPVAQELRARSTPHPLLPKRAGMDVRKYRLDDWVQPSPRWQTFCVIWEWPPYCTELGQRNIEIAYVGLGKVWIDDVELFTWEQARRR